MKVLHVLVGGEIGGGQVVCHTLLEALRARGDESVVISPTAGVFTERLQDEHFEVRFIPFRKTYHFQDAFRVARILKEKHIDIVHTHGMVPMNVQARLGAKLAGVPVISHLHGENRFRNYGLIRAYQKLLDNMTARLCEKIITVSHSTREKLMAQGIPSSSITTIHNGVDAEACKASKTREHICEEFGLEPARPLVGMVGSLCPMKGQAEFIMAAREVLTQVPEAKFMIVGKDIETGGRYEITLKQLVARLNLEERIIFTGYRSDVFDLVNAFDFFVLPSKVEGFPISILEATALKKAVVSTNVGGIPELVLDGETGILVPPEDVGALADALIDLLRNPQKAAEMGRRGYERVRQRFSKEKMIEPIFDLYARVMRKRGLPSLRAADIKCHPEPFACHSERSEESDRLEGKLREGSPVVDSSDSPQNDSEALLRSSQ